MSGLRMVCMPARYIIIDTSSIIFGLSNGKDVFKAVREQKYGYAAMVSEGIMRELENIKSKGGRYGRYAGPATALIARYGIRISADSSPVDSWILEEAWRNGYAVCTNDSELKRRLRAVGVRAFSIARSGRLR